MTAEMLANNSDETLTEDNSDETGVEVDDVDGGEEHFAGQTNEQEDETFWHGKPEELPDELKGAYKGMQGAFTKRMQRLSELENKYFESIDAANAAVLARSQADSPAATEEKEVVPEPPDLSKGAKPEDVIQYYVQQEVLKAIESSGVQGLAKEMQPVAHREKVLGAYRTYASETPELDHSAIAPLAGKVIDSDSELTELANTNPLAAIRLAARIARAELSVTATKQKSRKKRQAAPVSARSGTPVKQRRESMLEAATRALKEAGVPIDSF